MDCIRCLRGRCKHSTLNHLWFIVYAYISAAKFGLPVTGKVKLVCACVNISHKRLFSTLACIQSSSDPWAWVENGEPCGWVVSINNLSTIVEWIVMWVAYYHIEYDECLYVCAQMFGYALWRVDEVSWIGSTNFNCLGHFIFALPYRWCGDESTTISTVEAGTVIYDNSNGEDNIPVHICSIKFKSISWHCIANSEMGN